jgi:hypothetical protein
LTLIMLLRSKKPGSLVRTGGARLVDLRSQMISAFRGRCVQ